LYRTSVTIKSRVSRRQSSERKKVSFADGSKTIRQFSPPEIRETSATRTLFGIEDGVFVCQPCGVANSPWLLSKTVDNDRSPRASAAPLTENEPAVPPAEDVPRIKFTRLDGINLRISTERFHLPGASSQACLDRRRSHRAISTRRWAYEEHLGIAAG